MIREVTYYQAVCDVCGAVDDGGEFSAFSDPDTARMGATDSSEWTELEVPVPPGASGPGVYEYRLPGRPPRRARSVLVCCSHSGDGIQWCARCDGDLDEAGWSLADDGTSLTSRCACGYLNVAWLDPEPGGSR